MSPTPCRGTFPFNTRLTLTQADKIAEFVHARGKSEAIKNAWAIGLNCNQMARFIKRNGLDASRDAA